VGGLAVAFVFLSADVASQVEAAVTALAGVAAVATGVWAALPRGSESRVPDVGASAERTGPAITEGLGSKANSGVRGSGVARDTGVAKASGGGSANSGVDSVR
jgi:hypothetical protein